MLITFLDYGGASLVLGSFRSLSDCWEMTNFGTSDSLALSSLESESDLRIWRYSVKYRSGLLELTLAL